MKRTILIIILIPFFGIAQFNPIFFSAKTSLPICFLDAANNSSYPGSGSAWTDLRGFQNCTLTNGPSFNSSNGGSLQFDGVDDVGLMGSAFNYTIQNFSFSVWVYITSLTTTSSGQGPVLFFKGEFGTNGYYCQVNTSGGVRFVSNSPSAAVSGSPNSVISAGSWYNIVTVKNGTSVRIYINGADNTSIVGTHGNISSSSSSFALGAYSYPNVAPSGVYSNIRIAKFQAYIGALSPSDVTENFNKYRSVYGL